MAVVVYGAVVDVTVKRNGDHACINASLCRLCSNELKCNDKTNHGLLIMGRPGVGTICAGSSIPTDLSVHVQKQSASVRPFFLKIKKLRAERERVKMMYW